jgi:hypothetical protein
MVAPRVPDADAIGLLPGVHYVELDIDQFWSQLEWIEKNSELCKEISWNSHRWYVDSLEEYQKQIFPSYVDQLLDKSSDKKLKGWIAPRAMNPTQIPVTVIILNLIPGVSISEMLRNLSLQNYEAFEILVVSRESATSEESVRWIFDPTIRNSAEAMNLGWKGATGEIVCFLEPGDNWCFPDVLTKVVDYFASHEDLDAIYAKCERELEDSGLKQFWVQNDVEFMVGSDEFSRPTSTLFFRKRILESVGGLDQRFSHRHLYDLWLRVLIMGKVRFFPYVVTNSVDDRQTSDATFESTVEVVRIKAEVLKLSNIPESLSKKEEPILVETYLRGMVCAIGKRKFNTAIAFAVRAFLIRPRAVLYILRTFYESL